VGEKVRQLRRKRKGGHAKRFLNLKNFLRIRFIDEMVRNGLIRYEV